jgi:prepilin-type N-terminal cleavage/methylation domain-containing protein
MKRRSAFTLIELLVVISILLVLSGLVLAVFNTGRSSDRMRSAARIAQSAFLGAKDRALHAKDLRGVRVTRDLANIAFANGFIFVKPLPLQTTGNQPGQPQLQNVSVTRPGFSSGNMNATEVLITGQQGTTWQQQDANGQWATFPLKVRIPSGTGQWYTIAQQSISPPYWWTTDPNTAAPCLVLQVPYSGGNSTGPNAIDPTDTTASIDIQLGNDVLPFDQPIALPSGCIIDLNYSSPNIQAINVANHAGSNIDIMFSPRGVVSGFVGGIGPLHFLFRGLKDATAGVNPWAVGGSASANPDKSTEDRLILSVFPQTGLVQVFEIDPTDNFTNPSTTTPIASLSGGPDGIADNLFNFAQKGKTASR